MDLIPAPVVQQLHAQAPGGRRRTIETMGALRRVSLAFRVAAAEESPESSAPLRLSLRRLLTSRSCSRCFCMARNAGL